MKKDKLKKIKIDIRELSKFKQTNQPTKMKPVFKLYEVIILMIIVATISLFVGFLVTNKIYKVNNNYNNDENIKSLIDNYNYLTQNYYKEINKKELVNAAIEGMIKAIGDPYTNYIDGEESSKFNATLDGNYHGVGLEIANDDDDNIIIIRVFKDSPADKAGLKAGDIIKKINNKSVEKTKTSDFIEIVKKYEDKEFNLTVLRNEKNVTVKLKTGDVTLESVQSKIKEEQGKKIGYIYISVFANNTYSQLKEKLEELEKEGINGLILDVRGNSGGHLASVKKILSLFLDSSHVIYQLKDKEGTQKVYSEGKTTKTYPIVVLTNGSSASASEILAISLKEEYNAILVGEKTYGKNTVQEVQTLTDGNQYKVTTKNWLSPKGILTEGVEPDIKVQLDEDYLKDPKEENDNQLKKALDAFNK